MLVHIKQTHRGTPQRSSSRCAHTAYAVARLARSHVPPVRAISRSAPPHTNQLIIRSRRHQHCKQLSSSTVSAAPNLPAAEACRCSRSRRHPTQRRSFFPRQRSRGKSHALRQLGFFELSAFSRRNAEISPLQTPVRATLFLRRRRRPPLPSYLPLQPIRPASNRPAVHFFDSTDADHIYRKHRQSRATPPPAAPRAFPRLNQGPIQRGKQQNSARLR